MIYNINANIQNKNNIGIKIVKIFAIKIKNKKIIINHQKLCINVINNANKSGNIINRIININKIIF